MARMKYLLFCFSVVSFIATKLKCVICAKVLSEAKDRYAISGKGVSSTWLPDELKLLNEIKTRHDEGRAMKDELHPLTPIPSLLTIM